MGNQFLIHIDVGLCRQSKGGDIDRYMNQGK
eukprot:CAMPEP_0170946416 /NCGR_PEP_ID=MMETSP0735-20130129/27137_1 /TAXON_ID=186038 /ORGANISM="Fragilariopsis kerguelensis, Strain L26-C5" /LENGTH=30 /DNA_ID= /DNA_START= /DNA_END= /DNA_ORIENTATION=